MGLLRIADHRYRWSASGSLKLRVIFAWAGHCWFPCFFVPRGIRSFRFIDESDPARWERRISSYRLPLMNKRATRRCCWSRGSIFYSFHGAKHRRKANGRFAVRSVRRLPTCASAILRFRLAKCYNAAAVESPAPAIAISCLWSAASPSRAGSRPSAPSASAIYPRANRPSRRTSLAALSISEYKSAEFPMPVTCASTPLNFRIDLCPDQAFHSQSRLDDWRNVKRNEKIELPLEPCRAQTIILPTMFS